MERRGKALNRGGGLSPGMKVTASGLLVLGGPTLVSACSPSCEMGHRLGKPVELLGGPNRRTELPL